MLDLVIQNQQHDIELPQQENLQKWAAAALINADDVQVTLRVVDTGESRALNNEYRGKDKPTNVLSFPMDVPQEFLEVLDINLLGDLVVCAEIVEQEAAQQNKIAEAHWAHMLVHGMLHLQGFDHIDDDEAELMEKREISILKQLGFESPY
ncbi:MAG: rRNA maturation RNase YbeY [Gammaproteobacteria bacterium]|nr:rRNA maturation RNase YbeY [Gammaproteobacteria bacterium]